MVGSFNYLRILENLPAMFKSFPMPPAQALMMESMFADLQISSSSSLVFASNDGNGKVNTHIALPKEHLNEIMAVVMQIQAKVMKNMMQPSAPGSAEPAPAPAPAEAHDHADHDSH